MLDITSRFQQRGYKRIMYAATPLLGAYTNAELKPESRATALSMISLVSTAYQAAIGLPLGALAERSLSAWCLVVAAIIALSTLLLPLRNSCGSGSGSGVDQ